MDAKEYLDLLRDDASILRLAYYNGEVCDGRGLAVIIDEDHNIAVMLEDCGDAEVTMVKSGAIIKFLTHPETEPKIVGTPAYATPVVLNGQRLS